MFITITNVSVVYEQVDRTIDRVDVFFRAENSERSFSTNGYIPLEMDEYLANREVEQLTVIVKDRMITSIQEEDVTE